MKIEKIVLIIGLLLISITGMAEMDHDHQVKHNMVLFGEKEIFVSHIVYKSPHNYQVILKVDFNENIRQLYLEARAGNPNDEFIFLLDKMHIADIATLDTISGTLFRTDEKGLKTTLANEVILDKNHFKIIFFNELPLNLEDMR